MRAASTGRAHQRSLGYPSVVKTTLPHYDARVEVAQHAARLGIADALQEGSRDAE